MAYINIARKYRPQTFSELVGQEAISQTLKNAILTQKVSPAYLFCGARGIGKTTVARIFAKALRCEQLGAGDPCNTCRDCLDISRSESLDVIEIDGASNNGVDAIREIRENVAYAASRGFYKIYIIDEVHMLSTSAFNALLKTLEEPPAHTVFIFATTEVQKIPETILSRCQRFEFRRLRISHMTERLNYILKQEGLTFSQESLELLARQADGGLRDALSLLDQVIAYFGETLKEKELTEQEVLQALQLQDTRVVFDYLSALFKKDLNTCLRIIEDLFVKNADWVCFTDDCLDELRLFYLIALKTKYGHTLGAHQLEISENHYVEIETLVSTLEFATLERISQILVHTHHKLGWVSHPRFVLEMATVKAMHSDYLEKIEATLQRLSGETTFSSTPQPSEELKVEKREASLASVSDRKPVPMPLVKPISSETVVKQPVATAVENPSGKSWKGFVDMVMKKRPLLGALLSHASFQIQTQGEKRFVYLNFSQDSFFEKQIEEPKNRKDVLEYLQQYFGHPVELMLAKGQKMVSQSLESERVAQEEMLRQKTKEHPLVQAAQSSKLNAELVDIVIHEPR